MDRFRNSSVDSCPCSAPFFPAQVPKFPSSAVCAASLGLRHGRRWRPGTSFSMVLMRENWLEKGTFMVDLWGNDGKCGISCGILKCD